MRTILLDKLVNKDSMDPPDLSLELVGVVFPSEAKLESKDWNGSEGWAQQSGL